MVMGYTDPERMFGFQSADIAERIQEHRDKNKYKISYSWDKAWQRDKCDQCSYLLRESDPEECVCWCVLFMLYVGSYTPWRCQACIDAFGDEFRWFRPMEGDDDAN